MTTSKVEKVTSVKPYNGQNGTIYYHNLIMANGDKINIGKKKELAIGEELKYEIVETGQQEYNKAKPIFEERPAFGGKNNDDYVKGIEVGHAINNAVNMICAGVELDTEFQNTEEKIYKYSKIVMAISERLKSEK